MYLESERLIVRDFQIDDVFDLFEVLGDGEVMRSIEQPFSLYEVKDFILKYGMTKAPSVFALEGKSEKKVIGQIVFHSVDSDEVYEMGCVLGKKYWRQGYAYEVAKALIYYAFNSLNLHKIVCEARDIKKVLPLLVRLGMKQEALMRKHCKRDDEWQDLYWFAILKEEYFKE